MNIIIYYTPFFFNHDNIILSVWIYGDTCWWLEVQKTIRSKIIHEKYMKM